MHRLDSWCTCCRINQFCNILAQQGFPAGKTYFVNTQARRDHHQACDFRRGKQCIQRFKRHPFFRHAVDTAQVAFFIDRNAEIIKDTAKLVKQGGSGNILCGQGRVFCFNLVIHTHSNSSLRRGNRERQNRFQLSRAGRRPYLFHQEERRSFG